MVGGIRVVGVAHDVLEIEMLIEVVFVVCWILWYRFLCRADDRDCCVVHMFREPPMSDCEITIVSLELVGSMRSGKRDTRRMMGHPASLCSFPSKFRSLRSRCELLRVGK